MNGSCRSEMFDTGAVADAVRYACITELSALKPGSVSVHSDGHGMVVDDFVRSANAIAPALVGAGLSVGERILAAIEATRLVVDCNTNLGIVLLCAPLAHAALNIRPGQSLRAALGETLRTLDKNDTHLAYAAILMAEPAGLGEVAQHDVRNNKPDVGLLQVMRTAQRHDRIARQYVNNYADVFDVAVPRLYDGMERWGDEVWATASAYVGLLARFPDTHIERKYGLQLAQDISARAKHLDDMLLDKQATPHTLFAPLARFDAELKGKGINPGTSADLTVAALTVQRLQAYLKDSGQMPFFGRGTGPGCVSSPVSSTAN